MMAAEVVHAKLADAVWVVPCGPRPDKPSLKTHVYDRFIMCHNAVTTSFSADFPLQVDGIEINKAQALETPELLLRLEEKHPNIEFRFVAGSDLLPEIKSWGGDDYKDWHLSRRFIIVPRCVNSNAAPRRQTHAKQNRMWQIIKHMRTVFIRRRRRNRTLDVTSRCSSLPPLFFSANEAHLMTSSHPQAGVRDHRRVD